MLVVTRRKGETIYIDGNKIKVIVLDTRGSQVKLGIEAPRQVSVYREELYDMIEAEKLDEQTRRYLQESTGHAV